MNSNASGGGAFVYQIFYDQRSREALDPGFIPLDNTRNERPDWFEFWVIREFLKRHRLAADAWYGFLSPKFLLKTGFRSQDVMQMLDQHHQCADGALFSFGWDQLAYFLNPFEQGEVWHPGLADLAQGFFDDCGYQVDVKRLVTHSASAVFSNFIVAKARYWSEWLKLADRFFHYVESETSSGGGLQGQTSYGNERAQAPMKTFVQERFAAVLLSQGAYRIVAADQSLRAPLFSRLFRDDYDTRRALQTCDFLKQRYCQTGDPEYLTAYAKVRSTIPINPEVSSRLRPLKFGPKK